MVKSNSKKKNLSLMSGSKTQRAGAKGERRARLYLVLHGYKILEKNTLYGHKEIDIIAKKGKTYAFVEVKSRTGARAIAPALSVNTAKKKRVISAANAYVARNGIRNAYLRFDIIEVDLGKRLPLSGVKHIENAFN